MVLFIGRTNVGKSTLINSLLGQKLAFPSKKAGKTKALNFFLVDERFYLVDAPGYGSTGFATMSTVAFAEMMEKTLPSPYLKCIALLLDFRVLPKEDDIAFYRYLASAGKNMVVVLTKVDKMNQKELSAAKKCAEELGFTRVLTSDNSPATSEKIRTAILACLH